MESNCAGCTQKAIEENARRNELENKAQELANQANEWVGIYLDENNKEQYTIAQPGFGFIRYITPKLQHVVVL